jgi:hypothetical protein
MLRCLSFFRRRFFDTRSFAVLFENVSPIAPPPMYCDAMDIRLSIAAICKNQTPKRISDMPETYD